jgi:hypothetical protein
MKTKNPSECLFEEYLNQHYLEFDYEPAIGRKRPDYLVYVFSKAVFEEHQLGGVIFEVKEFDSSVDFVKGNALSFDEGWFFRCKPIREKINAAERQLREYKKRFPCVVVLYHPKCNPTVANVIASMYGNIQQDWILETFLYDTFTSKIRPFQCRTISAVAILDTDENKEVLLQVVHNRFAYLDVSWAFGSPDIQVFPRFDKPHIGKEDWDNMFRIDS